MGHVTSHEAFARLLIEHEPVFLRYILTKVPNRADAHDIVQECSAALWGKFEMDGFPPKGKAAKKGIADLLRKHGGKTGEELKVEGK